METHSASLEFAGQRKQLVQSMHLKEKRIENAFLSVPRDQFFPPALKKFAYEDNAFPIGSGQTISQPSTIAAMLELLSARQGDRVLEVGAGSGYVAALLSEIVGPGGKVFGIELLRELHQKATQALLLLGYENIQLRGGNGSSGWEQEAPFDRILVSAAAPGFPKPLFRQLKEGGRAVAPIGDSFTQDLVLLQKENGKPIGKERKQGYVFVPLK